MRICADRGPSAGYKRTSPEQNTYSSGQCEAKRTAPEQNTHSSGQCEAKRTSPEQTHSSTLVPVFAYRIPDFAYGPLSVIMGHFGQNVTGCSLRSAAEERKAQPCPTEPPLVP